jgi:hypothetical protein
MPGDRDGSYGRRLWLTPVQADGIQPYLYFHIYTGLGTFLDRIQLSLTSITISTKRFLWKTLHLPIILLHAGSRDLLSCRPQAPGVVWQVTLRFWQVVGSGWGVAEFLMSANVIV